MSTIFITIANANIGFKLLQPRWSDYQSDFQILINDLFYGDKATVNGTWYTLPTAGEQSMCISVEIPAQEDRHSLELALRTLCNEYEQESIKWEEVPQTLFVYPG